MLPAILSDHGYTTFSACGAPAGYWNMGEMHARLGIQQSAFLPDYSFSEWIGVGLADQDFFEQTVPKLSSLDGPFFSFLITASVHWPFDLPESHRTFDPGRFRGSIVGNYLQAVHYFDRAFGRFLTLLRNRDLLDQSLLVVFGDHQAHLTDRPETEDLMAALGGRFASGAELPVRLWELQHDVPLLIRLPNSAVSGVRDTPAGHLDIAPTILVLTGVSEARPVMLGAIPPGDSEAIRGFPRWQRGQRRHALHSR